MRQEFITEYIKANCGCYTPEKLLTAYKENKDVLCYETPSCSVTLDEILNSNIPLKDKYWFVCKKLTTKEQNQQIAISVAEIVLPIYEAKYPTNTSVRECIEAARQYITGHITLEKLLKKRRVAYATYVVTDATNVAASAVDAVADVAIAVVDAINVVAVTASYAAVDIAVAIATYVDAAVNTSYKKQLLQFLITFCKEN